jgi:DNA-binding response OmpR family regulator
MEHQPAEVLLIEDDLGDARLVKEMLAEAGDPGFNLSHAVRLADGLRLLAARRFDIVLLDLTLPDSAGMITLLKVKNAARAGVPVVVLTGLDDDVAGSWSLQEGATDYLVKGKVDANLLEFSIRYAIEQKRGLAEGPPTRQDAGAFAKE